MATIATVKLDAATARNPIATALANSAFRNRVVRAKAGKGSYTRKDKHKGAQGW